MNKKAITILGAIFLLIVGVLGFLWYQKSRLTPPPPPAILPPPPVSLVPPPAEPPPGTLPPPPGTQPPPAGLNSVKAVKLTNNVQAVSPVLFYSGSGVTFFNKNGQLFQADIESSGSTFLLSNTRELTVPLKQNLTKILWPQAGRNYIAEGYLDNNKRWSVYVAETGEYKDLPPQVTSVNWMPGGDKILYVWLDNNNKATLNVANPDNTGYQVVTDFWEPDNEISLSPDGKNILFFQTKNEATPNKINLVTSDGKIFKSVVQDGFNRGVLWSPDSKKFLFMRRETGSSRFQLWVANLFSGEIKNLNLYTSIDKVLWSGDSQYVYAAVPNAAAAQAGAREDSLHKISLATGDVQEFKPEVAVDVAEMFLTSAQNRIIFKNLLDGDLYTISLAGPQ